MSFMVLFNVMQVPLMSPFYRVCVGLCPLRLRSALHRVDEPAFPFFYVKRGVVIDSHVPRRVPHRVTPDDKRVSYTTLTLTTSFHEDYKQRVDDTPREPPPRWTGMSCSLLPRRDDVDGIGPI